MKEVRLTADAEEDLLAAVDFYEHQEPGAGKLLFVGILAELRRLRTSHGFHRIRHGFHKVSSTRFPHAVYYAQTDREIIVVAIVDERRDPASIRRDLLKRSSNE